LILSEGADMTGALGDAGCPLSDERV